MNILVETASAPPVPRTEPTNTTIKEDGVHGALAHSWQQGTHS